MTHRIMEHEDWVYFSSRHYDHLVLRLCLIFSLPLLIVNLLKIGLLPVIPFQCMTTDLTSIALYVLNFLFEIVMPLFTFRISQKKKGAR
jgi:hypothetical protein